MADPELDEAEPSGGGRGRLLVLIGGALGLVLLGAGGGLAVTTYYPFEEDGAEGEEGEEGEAEAQRKIHTLGSFTVNLRGAGGGRMLRMEVAVEVKEDDLALVEEKTPALQDGVLMVASDYTYADLEGVDGKLRLKDELLGRLNASLESERVERIYLTQFAVQ
jgi:flagellar protein FliL